MTKTGGERGDGGDEGEMIRVVDDVDGWHYFIYLYILDWIRY